MIIYGPSQSEDIIFELNQQFTVLLKEFNNSFDRTEKIKNTKEKIKRRIITHHIFLSAISH